MSGTETVELQETRLGDTTLFRFPSLVRVDGLAHAVTSKPWNMATHCGPERDLAVERRRRVCDFLGLSFHNLTAAEQIHSPHVVKVRPSDVGAGRDGRHSSLRFVDGLICDIPGVAVMQFSADCPVVFLVEPQRRILGTAHASWRGTVSQISAALLRRMRATLDVDSSELIAGICPCAGPVEYEVGEDVRRIAMSMLPETRMGLVATGPTSSMSSISRSVVTSQTRHSDFV